MGNFFARWKPVKPLKPAKKRTFTDYMKLLLAAAIFFGACGFGVFIFLMPFLDRQDVQPVRCHVVSAVGDIGRDTGRGASASYNRVLFQTSNCGRVSFTDGVTRGNKGEIAAKVKPDHDYIFRMGWTSRVMVPLQRSIGMNINAVTHSFEEVP